MNVDLKFDGHGNQSFGNGDQSISVDVELDE